MSNFVLGMPTGLTVSAPAPSEEPEVILTAQGHRAAGGPSIRIRSNIRTRIKAGWVVRIATAFGVVTADTEVFPAQSSDLPLDTLTPTGTQPGNPVSLSAGGKAYLVPGASFGVTVHGTSDTDLQINEVTQDSTSALGNPEVVWATDEVVSKNWQLDRRGLYHANDPGYRAVEESALTGDLLKVRRVLPDANGSPHRVQSGFARVTAFRNPSPATGVIEASWVFKGHGPLAVAPASGEPVIPDVDVDLSGVMLDFTSSEKSINHLVFL